MLMISFLNAFDINTEKTMEQRNSILYYFLYLFAWSQMLESVFVLYSF